ncbi:hypothetical protein FCK90_04335 [Kocuria coralli]|uniref:Helix-turn-helix domain-containing protein n=1 Tax=Kocuria coralli TaxID=1461025 RepID=A0A5J5L1D7_9MICC|nr:hypothetical protein [Kocuria coralli]KAA9394771.1 hypothetical protein FCK90_04335 [Kocuria coralli]
MTDSTLTQLRDRLVCLADEAEKIRAERDDAIREAVEDGTPIAQVARDAGVTRRIIYKIIDTR